MKIDNQRFADEKTTSSVGQTVAILGHRVNNILQGINGGSHLVDIGFERNDPSIGQKGWEIVKRNQEKLANLLSQLIELGKPISLELESTSFARLTDIVKTTLDSLSNENCDFQFDPEIELDDQILKVDIEGVESIITNLTTLARNASEFFDQEKRSIKVSLGYQRSKQGANHVLIAIEYQGNLICTNVQDQKRYLSGAIKSTVGGIEFAVSNKIANSHGGKVSIAAPNEDGLQQRIEATLPFECN